MNQCPIPDSQAAEVQCNQVALLAFDCSSQGVRSYFVVYTPKCAMALSGFGSMPGFSTRRAMPNSFAVIPSLIPGPAQLPAISPSRPDQCAASLVVYPHIGSSDPSTAQSRGSELRHVKTHPKAFVYFCTCSSPRIRLATRT